MALFDAPCNTTTEEESEMKNRKKILATFGLALLAMSGCAAITTATEARDHLRETMQSWHGHTFEELLRTSNWPSPHYVKDVAGLYTLYGWKTSSALSNGPAIVSCNPLGTGVIC